MSSLTFYSFLVNGIQSGNLEVVKSLGISQIDLSKPIPEANNILISTKINKPLIASVSRPTPIILAILFEQPSILRYFLFKIGCKLDYVLNGWCCLHYASASFSSQCLIELLKCEFIQNNLSKPVEYTKSTNSLHIAVANRQHQNVITLLNFRPSIRLTLDGKINRKSALVSSSPKFNLISPNQKTDSLNLPLHIAAKNNDWEMIQILVAFGADLGLKNQNQQTPTDVAIQYNFTDLVQKIHTNIFEDKQSLIQRYSGTSDKEKIEQVKCFPKSYQDVGTVKKELEDVNNTIKELSLRIQELEKRK